MRAFRRPGTASTLSLFSVALALGTVYTFAPEWSRAAGLDVWNLPALNAQLHQIDEERADVNASAEEAAKRRALANHIALKFLDGQSLATGTDDLMELFQTEHGMVVTLQSLYPNTPSIRHLFALHAIDRLKRLVDNPVQRNAVVARLEAEYKKLDPSADVHTGKNAH
jgi:hypothetical protein